MPTKSKKKSSKNVVSRHKSKKNRKSKKKVISSVSSISKTATTTTISKTTVTSSSVAKNAPATKKVVAAAKKSPSPNKTVAIKKIVAKKKVVAGRCSKKIVAKIVDVKKIVEKDDDDDDEEEGGENEGEQNLKVVADDSMSEEEGAAGGEKQAAADVVKEPFGPKPGDLLNKRFKVGSLLGCGGFGAVYNCLDEKNGQQYAIKAEMIKPRNGIPGLELEVTVLKKLQKSPHFARYVDSGECKNANYLIMQLLGQNLAQLRRFCPGQRYGLSTSLRVGLQCFDAIHFMHQKGLLHRDIKPGNYLNGIDQRDLLTIFLVDFGLVRQFTRDGKVRPKRPRAPFRGTKRYASINALKELDYGRHDDLISWIYTMVELSTGFLPWATEPDRLKLADAKIKGEKVLCLYVDPVFSVIYGKLTELKYENEPDYEKYKLLLRGEIDRHKFKNSDHFDWQTGYVQPAIKKLKNQDSNDDILENFNEFVVDAVENVVGNVSESIRKQLQNGGIKVEGKKATVVKKVVKSRPKITSSKKVYCKQEVAPPDDEDYIQIENEQNDALLDQV